MEWRDAVAVPIVFDTELFDLSGAISLGFKLLFIHSTHTFSKLYFAFNFELN